MLAGAKGAKEIGDRREAIRAAGAMLQDGDILVVAGKGHEQGQIVGDKAHPSTTWRRPPRPWTWSMADPLWTSEEIARATGGTTSGGGFSHRRPIDTRTIEPGDLFVALAGPNFDGHEPSSPRSRA